MKKSIFVGALLVSSLTFGQKKNETSAAVEYKNKFLPALQSKDYETAKKAILSAKSFIDLATENAETKESPKTQYYVGEIYLGIVRVAQESNDMEFMKPIGTREDLLAKSVAFYSKSYNNGTKFRVDVTDGVQTALYFCDKNANEAYKNADFKEASAMYNWQANFMSSINQMDSSALFNAAISAEKANDYQVASVNYHKLATAGYKGAATYSLASSAYRKTENIAKAKEVINEGRAKYPNDRDLLLELVNLNIDEKNPAGAEKALTDAIAADPKNKQLYYTIGTIYIELKDNDKAEGALIKALEIDPNYEDAQYQLGAHLVSAAGDLKSKANSLKIGDPQYDVLVGKSTETYKRAISPLEGYIVKNPNDKDVLNILFQLHRALGNSEKAAEYKKRADAVK